MKELTRILIVEDKTADADLAKHAIQKGLEDCDFRVVETREDFLNALEVFQPEVILSDYSLPRFDGMRALQLTRERAPLTPLIIWTGSISEDVAVECMKAGANNYVLKDNLKRLAPAVIHALEERQLLLERKQAEETIQNSEKRFRALIENGLDDISLLASNGTLLWESPSIVRNLNYAPGTFVGRNIFELMHPDDLEWTQRQFQELVREPGRREKGEFRLRRADSTWRWVEAIATNMLNEPSVNAIVINYRDVTERKQAEEALRASEARFRTFVDHATDAFFLHDERGTILDVNHQACECLGYRPEELIGVTPFDFDVDLVPSFFKQVGARLKAGETVAFDTRYRRKDGTIFPVEVRIGAFQEGERSFGIAFARDITERKQAEDALRQSETRYRTLVETQTEFIVRWKPDGTRTFANEAYCRYFGLTPEQAVSTSFMPLVHEQDRRAVEDKISRLISGVTNVEVDIHRVIKPDGSIGWQEWTDQTMRDEGGQLLELQSVGRDITERKQAEKALQDSEKRFRALIEHGLDSISLLRADGTLIWESPSAIRLLDYAPDEYVGQNIFTLMHPDDLEWTQNMYTRLVQEPGSHARGKFRLRHAHGTWRWMEAIVTNMLNEPSVNAIVVNYRDITERKQVEDARREEQNLLRTLIDNIPDRIYAKDLQGRKTLSNTADWKASGGKTMEDVIGKTDFDTYPPELAESFWQKDKAILDTGQPMINFEEPGLDFEGKPVSILSTKIPLHDHDGKVIGLVGVGRDITERKQIEQALKESQIKLNYAQRIAHVGHFEHDLDTDIITMSDELYRILGLQQREIMTSSEAMKWIHPEDREEVARVPSDAIKTDQSFKVEYRIVRSDGEERFIYSEGNVSRDNLDHSYRAFGIAQDITERKRVEAKLQASESRYRLATQATKDVIWEWDPESNQLLWTENAQLVLGYPAEEIGPAANWWDEHIHPEDRERVTSKLNTLITTVGGESVWSDEYLFQLKNGSYAYIDDHAYIERDSTGTTIRMIGAMSDITSRKEAEIERQVLLEIMQGFASTKDLQELLRLVHHSVAKVIYAENFFVVLYHQNSGLFEEIYSVDQYDLPEPPSKLEKSITSYVFRSNEPLLLTQERFEELVAQGEVELVGTDSASWLGVPLKTSTRTIGVMAIQDYENDNRYSEHDKFFLVSIAAQVALAIERKQAEEALQENERRFRALIENSNDVIATVQADGKITYVSPAITNVLGYNADEYTDKSGFEFIHPDDIAESEKILVETLQNPGVAFTTLIRERHKDGSWRWVEGSITNLLTEPSVQALVVNYHDVTERKQAEEALHKSEALYRQAMEIAGAVPYYESYHDEGRRIKYEFIGEGIRQITGYGPEEFNAELWDSLVEEVNLVEDLTGYSLEEGIQRVRSGENSIWKCEHRLRDRSGNVHWVFEAAVELRDENGVSHGSIGTYQDITKRKQAEEAEREQRVLAEALRDTAETLSSSLSYEEVLDHILAAAGRVVPHDAATIMLIDGDVARVVRSYGYDKRGFGVEVMGIQLPLAGTHNLQEMLETRQPVIVYDTHSYLGWKRLKTTDWLRSNVGAPISIQDQVIGFILLDSQTPEFFTAVHAERLEAFANQAAIAIQNAHLLQQAQEEIVERKRIEESLQAEREKAQKYLDIAGVMMLALDQDGIVTLINQKGCELLGYPADEIIGKNWIDTFLPKSIRSDLQGVSQQLISGNVGPLAYYENTVLTKNGEERLIAWHNTVVRDGQGVIVSTLSSGEDVTDRKRAEAQLRVSEERFRQLADNIQEAFWMTDAETGEEIYMSSAAETIWERPIESLMNEPDAFINSVFPADQPAVLAAIEKEKHGERVEIQYRIIRPNGTIRWVWDRAFPISDETGKVKRIAGISADITERRESEVALVKSQSRYRELFDSSPISIWEEDFSLVKKHIDLLLEGGVADLQSYIFSHPDEVMRLASLVAITDVNQASLELYGIEHKEVLLKNLAEILGEEAIAHFSEEILGLLSPQKRFQWEGTDKTLDGKPMDVVVNGSLSPSYEEDWSKVIVSISDITERKRAEEEIRRRAKETSALLETSLALTNLDLQATLQTIGNSAKTLFSADGCRIFLVEPDGQSLRCVLALQENFAAFENLRIKMGEGVTGTVAVSGQAEIVNEMQNDPRSVQVPGTEEDEPEAIMFAPLKERDHSIGVLSIRRAGKERPFQPADLELLEAFASLAASSVSNARLFDETQERLAELEALYENGLAVGRLLMPSEIGSRIIDTFARYLKWHHVTIRLTKEENDDLELVAFNLPHLSEDERTATEQHFVTRINKIGQGLSGQVIQTGIPLCTGNVHDYPQYVDTYSGIQSGLYMPLKAGERVIGVISVESEVPDAFTEQDERLLATLANQAAIAFENARLYETVQRELSERKRAEEALRLSETHYRELADSITDILFELDQDLRYTHWNKASEIFSGIPAEAVIGKSIRDVFETSADQLNREEIYNSVLKEQRARTFETEVLAKGQKRALEINAYPSARGASVVAKDITDRKRTEIIMEKRFELMEFSTHHSLNDLMQKTIDEVSELTGSFIGFLHFVDEDQTTLGMQTWSTNALQLFQVPHGEGEHLSLDQAGVWAEAARQRRPLIQNDYESIATRKSLPQGHTPITRELVIPIIRNERIMAIMGIANKPHDYTHDDLEIAARLADYAWDVTERKQMELTLEAERNQLAQRVDERTADLSRANSNLARALRVKDEFLANMSHELRTPLNAILGLSESLSEQTAGPLNEKQQKYITTISESGHHLLSLINDILDLAKIDAGQVTLDINKVDVRSVCQASLRMIKQLAQKKHQDVSLEIDSDVAVMWADERRLKQMLVNLLGNAVKFTPEYGKLGLEVHGDEEANKISFIVWDKGIGIKEDDLVRLFQPFVQLNSGLARETTGTGLGLALVAQMARLHGGSIQAVSEPEHGSRFTVVLPWEPALTMDAAARMKITGKFRAINPDEKNKPTILLVEDTLEVIMMIKDYLELAGYKVVTAQDGVDAIVQAKLVRPDLILMDVQMPRMDGMEATHKLRSEAEFRYTPIIALTALAMPNDRERCIEAGMDEYISKPVNLKALIKIIQSCLFNNKEDKLS